MDLQSVADRKKIAEVAFLDDLIGSLQRLRDNDGFSRSLDGEFWFKSTSILDNYAPKDEDEARAQYLAYIKKMKSLHAEISPLLQSTVDELWRTSVTMLPVHLGHGLASIPDELLAEIIEWSGCDPLDLRLVSRRFYRIVMSLPRLWTYIQFDTPPNLMKLCLEHSREQTVEIFTSVDEPDDFERRMEMLRPHASRIGVLQFVCMPHRAQLLDQALRGLDLPRLQELDVQHIRRTVTEGEAVKQCKYYDDWFVPKLERLTSEDDIPKPIRGMSLKECKIHLTQPAIWDMTQLSAFFAACPALERLKVYFKDFESTTGTFESVQLHQLKFLEMTVAVGDNYSINNLPLEEIVDGLVDESSIEVLRLTTFLEDANEFEECLFTVFRDDRSYSNLKSLDLSVRETTTAPQNMMRRILKTTPALQHLALETLGLKLSGSSKLSLGFPPLKHLCFRRCFRGDYTFFSAFEEALRKKWEAEVKGGRYDDVTVEFIGCSNLRGDEEINSWGRYFKVVWQDANSDWRYYPV